MRTKQLRLIKNFNDAFEFIANKGGITSEAYYPYKGKDRSCKVKKETQGVAQIKGYENVPSNSEKALLKAVANQPVSVYIDAGALQFYSSGIFTGKCGTAPNHAATVIGYGKARGGAKYWLVKNSWGTKWGEKGYIRMKRDIRAKEGLCGSSSLRAGLHMLINTLFLALFMHITLIL